MISPTAYGRRSPNITACAIHLDWRRSFSRLAATVPNLTAPGTFAEINAVDSVIPYAS